MTASRRRTTMSRKSRLGIMGVGIFGILALVAVQFLPSGSAAAASHGVFSDALRPAQLIDPDRGAVELGVRFVPRTDVTVTGIRFYQSPANAGPHTGRLWSAKGKVLAKVSFPRSSKTGWTEATLSNPVTVAKGRTYTASYSSPHGGYAADQHGFDTALSDGVVTYPRNAGVYVYEVGKYPTQRWNASNYYVDVVYRKVGGDPTTPVGPSSTPTPSPSATVTSNPEAGGSTPPATSNGGGPVAALASLPRIPWEGGSDYWKKFPATDRANWDDPSFFPVVVWFNGISSNAEAQYDKSVGINTYIGMDSSTPYKLFQDNGVYWIGDKLNSSFTDASTNWVGNFLEDEPDGRYSENAAAGRALLQNDLDSVKGNGRFNYTNFTQMVISKDMPASDANAYVNNYTDAVSLDMYWYTIPYCSWTPYRDTYLVPVSQANCRTASSYGKVVQSLRQRDATDGKLQPIWQFVEDLNGGPGDEHVGYISPGQLKGAVMNSIINEARGIVYFNQSLSGNCTGGSILRQSQVTSNFCGATQVQAMTDVDGQIRSLAPIINSQSYQYSFGSGLNTMLKSYDGSIYVFSMVDGSSKPGARSFQLPAGVSASSAQVMFENRTVPVSSGGSFSDSFANEYSYHIYKITPGS